MNPRLRALLGLLHTFGGLIAFYAALHFWGLRMAIAATLAFVLIDGAYRLLAREPMPLIWMVSNGLVLVLGGVDLFVRTPFLLLYEASITNALVGVVFAVGAAAETPLMVSFAELNGARLSTEDRPELVAYLRALTLAWALAFFLRAGVFLWIGFHNALGRAVTLRLVFGWTVLGVMIPASVRSRDLFAFCQRCGLFRPASPPIPRANADEGRW